MKDFKVFNLFRNWVSMLGMLGAILAFTSIAILMVLDTLAHFSNPYIGVLTYIVAPIILAGCIFLIISGMIWQYNRIKKGMTNTSLPVIDFGKPGVMRKTIIILIVLGITSGFSALLTARMYHYTESDAFCGTVCHEVMEPEYTAYQNSPHSNVGCSECHIGSGAEWFVKAKLSGLHQVWAVLRGNFHRPIKTPIENLRPARDTCHTCHRPEKFFGAVLRNWTYYLPDKNNTPWTIKMLVHIGGGDPDHGAVQGVHWHMEGVNDVEYIATDDKRLEIPWVRVTDQNGKVTVYQTTEEDKVLTKEQVAAATPRHMDCLDCHNRPTHNYWAPNDAMDMALSSGRIDADIPRIKARGAELLGNEYETKQEALDAIANTLNKKYPAHPKLTDTTAELQRIFSNNFFPEMKARWDVHPDHIGHKFTPGCFRCHDGKHKSESGKVIRDDCSVCHTILAQGEGTHLKTLSASGMEFKHPEDIDGMWKEELCHTCHTGAP
ncbi:MAG: NapC/NirT family cytochrome c [Kiritimatiellae bacterium]|nr:NapC/NirT family cytochrome c [Kiritimatiellia bacterium]